MAKFADRVPSAGAAPAAGPVVADASFLGLWPALFEYLSLDRWEDGSHREPATLLILFEEGRWKACVNDKANGRTGWRSADSFTGLLDAVEAGLAGGGMDWRRPRPANSRKR